MRSREWKGKQIAINGHALGFIRGNWDSYGEMLLFLVFCFCFLFMKDVFVLGYLDLFT